MSDGARILRLGTRGSRLAVRQTEWIAAQIRERAPGIEIEIRTIRTTGDRVRGPLREIGGKGLFTKEIEEALRAGDVDAGIHSLKDLPAGLPPGLEIAAVPVREDPRDAIVGSTRGGLPAVPRHARVGTGSLRRQALLRHLRPDLEIVDLRGNVDTRIGKWRSGELDAV
ncbi:MAG: hydroxymethylbilane synthase, partial [Candidatus Binatia bacterium]